MGTITENIKEHLEHIPSNVKLIAVSKKKTAADIREAYDAGQRAFGENYVQELTDKHTELPSDIEWHFIGHLQSNKVKFIAPFVSWIHAVESEKLLNEINKEATKNGRAINCLLQVHVAEEESKFGFSEKEIIDFCNKTDFTKYQNAKICGIMGMASFTENMEQVRKEFKTLQRIMGELQAGAFILDTDFKEISMGMSSDWKIAVEEGSTMVRIGSAIFGSRN